MVNHLLFKHGQTFLSLQNKSRSTDCVSTKPGAQHLAGNNGQCSWLFWYRKVCVTITLSQIWPVPYFHVPAIGWPWFWPKTEGAFACLEQLSCRNMLLSFFLASIWLGEKDAIWCHVALHGCKSTENACLDLLSTQLQCGFFLEVMT